jgi:hypothetical protein
VKCEGAAELVAHDPDFALRNDRSPEQNVGAESTAYSGGGAFQEQKIFGYTGRPSHGSRSLANLYDLSVDYQVNPHLTLTGYYALATGRTVIEKIYPGGGIGQLGYAELNWKF